MLPLALHALATAKCCRGRCGCFAYGKAPAYVNNTHFLLEPLAGLLTAAAAVLLLLLPLPPPLLLLLLLARCL
jgi:hypothetical protein